MAEGGSMSPPKLPPSMGGTFLCFGGEQGGASFSADFRFSGCSPPVWGGANRRFWGAPPYTGGSKVQFGVIRGGAGGTIVWNFQNQFSDDSPPEWGGARGGLICRFGGERGGALPPYSDRASYTTMINQHKPGVQVAQVIS